MAPPPLATLPEAAPSAALQVTPVSELTTETPSASSSRRMVSALWKSRRSRHASRSDNLASISVEESGSAAKHTMEAWRKRVGRLAVYATARSGGAKPVALHRRAATESVLKQANLPAEWFVIF
mmetsp:Transcript_68155/g.137104  ORF Transcript_68155/g.137104 Transcript_68155/m.137104 type:complete len:124 (-) Transcript_68155:23-394(-)